MTKRDYMLSALHHEEALIPSWSMAFENIETACCARKTRPRTFTR